MSHFITDVEFAVINCCTCHMQFAITRGHERRLRNKHSTFYCPAGHAQHFTGENEAERLRRLLRNAEQRSARTNQQLKTAVRANKRIRRRISNGVCPCCNRTFQNLMQHMHNEHPEFGRNDHLKVLRTSCGLTQADLAEEAGVSMHHVSAFERNKGVPMSVEERLESWLMEHGSA